MSNHEATEQHVSKSAGQNNDASHCMNQVLGLWNDGSKMANNTIKDVTNTASHIDIPNLFGTAVHQGAAAVENVGKQAWKAADSTDAGHFIINDVCDNDPFKVGLAGVATVGAGVIVLAVAAPEALAASVIGSQAMVGTTALAGTFAGAGLAMDYKRRHP